MKKILIVGAGISGCTLAHLLKKNSKDYDITIIDKRRHIGGNCYDGFYEDTDIRHHKYGSHIFHTKDKEIWNFVNKYADIIPYTHKVISYSDGNYVPVPINNTTLELLGCSFEEAKERLYKNYTIKQWGFYNEDALKRIKLSNEDGHYFPNQYQGLIKDYISFFNRLIEGIEIKLNTEYDRRMELEYDHIFYSGSIDELFDYDDGILEYRSLRFENELLSVNEYLPNPYPVVNTPEEKFQHTRIIEHKKLTGQHIEEKTLISKEYSEQFEVGKNERFYPINNANNNRLWQLYYNRMPINMTPIGRLGTYRYLDMDTSISKIFDLVKSLRL